MGNFCALQISLAAHPDFMLLRFPGVAVVQLSVLEWAALALNGKKSKVEEVICSLCW
jgi:hypothetical protein